MDDRLQLISARLRQVDKEISDLEWTDNVLKLGDDKLQALYLEREHLQHLLHKGDSYIPNF